MCASTSAFTTPWILVLTGTGLLSRVWSAFTLNLLKEAPASPRDSGQDPTWIWAVHLFISNQNLTTSALGLSCSGDLSRRSNRCNQAVWWECVLLYINCAHQPAESIISQVSNPWIQATAATAAKQMIRCKTRFLLRQSNHTQDTKKIERSCSCWPDGHCKRDVKDWISQELHKSKSQLVSHGSSVGTFALTELCIFWIHEGYFLWEEEC